MAFRLSTTLVLLATFCLLAPVKAAPTPYFTSRDASTTDFQKQNGLDAQKLNAQFSTMKATDTCQDGQMACITSSFAQCVSGKWVLTPCSSGTICVALPLVSKPGTSISCDSQGDSVGRFAAAGVTGGLTGSDASAATSTTAPAPPVDSGDSDDEDECTDDDGDDATDDDDSECDQDDDDTPSPSSMASASQTSATAGLNRRQSNVQFFTITPSALSSSTSVIATQVSSSIVAPPAQTFLPPSSASIPVISASSDTLSSTSVVSTASTATSTAFGTDPTGVVIGTDGVRTVTVVSTIIVVETACGVPSASAPAPVTTGTILGSAVNGGVVFPTVSTLSSAAAPTFIPATQTVILPSVSAVASSSAAVGSVSQVTGVNAPSSIASPVVPIASSSAVISSPAAPEFTVTQTTVNAISFSFPPAPSVTAAPVGNDDNGSSVDIGALLTATL